MKFPIPTLADLVQLHAAHGHRWASVLETPLENIVSAAVAQHLQREDVIDYIQSAIIEEVDRLDDPSFGVCVGASAPQIFQDKRLGSYRNLNTIIAHTTGSGRTSWAFTFMAQTYLGFEFKSFEVMIARPGGACLTFTLMADGKVYLGAPKDHYLWLSSQYEDNMGVTTPCTRHLGTLAEVLCKIQGDPASKWVGHDENGNSIYNPTPLYSEILAWIESELAAQGADVIRQSAKESDQVLAAAGLAVNSQWEWDDLNRPEGMIAALLHQLHGGDEAKVSEIMQALDNKHSGQFCRYAATKPNFGEDAA